MELAPTRAPPPHHAADSLHTSRVCAEGQGGCPQQQAGAAGGNSASCAASPPRSECRRSREEAGGRHGGSEDVEEARCALLSRRLGPRHAHAHAPEGGTQGAPHVGEGCRLASGEESLEETRAHAGGGACSRAAVQTRLEQLRLRGETSMGGTAPRRGELGDVDRGLGLEAAVEGALAQRRKTRMGASAQSSSSRSESCLR